MQSTLPFFVISRELGCLIFVYSCMLGDAGEGAEAPAPVQAASPEGTAALPHLAHPTAAVQSGS